MSINFKEGVIWGVVYTVRLIENVEGAASWPEFDR
jgi:hypothetical protein